MKNHLPFLIFLFWLPLYGHANSDIALLKKQLSEESDPKKRSEIYSLLSWKTFIDGQESHKSFSDSARITSQKHNYIDGMALYCFQEGGKFLLEYQNDKAEFMFNKTFDLIKTNQKHYLLPLVYLGLSWIDIEKDKLDEALKKLNLIDHFDLKDQPTTRLFLSVIKNQFYLKLGDLPLGKKHLREGLSILNSKKTQDEYSIIALLFFSKFLKTQDNEKAEKALLEGVKIANQMNFKLSKVLLCNEMALLNLKRQRFSDALYYSERVEKVSKHVHIKNALIVSILTQAEAHLSLNNISQGKRKLNQANTLVNQSNAHIFKTQIQLLYSKLYAKKKRFDQAFSSLSSYVLDQNKQVDTKNKKHIEVLSRVVQREKNSNLALKEEHIRDRSTIEKTTLYIVVFIVLLLASLLIAVFLYIRDKDSKRYNNKLKAEVEKQTYLLKQSNSDLEKFATMISHDLKGPLSFLLKSYDYIKTHIQETNDRVIQDYFEAMISSSKQMIALIDDLLVYSKAHSRKMVLAQVDTERLIDKIIGSIQTTTSKNDVEISYIDLPIIFSDESHLYMIFKNLIENAIKYNNSKIREVVVNYKKKLNHHQFSIIDNGIGIAGEDKAKVFEMHRRLKATEGFEGMGIGLATCSIAVSRLGGKIIVVPKQTKGTTIQFTIPINSINSNRQ